MPGMTNLGWSAHFRRIIERVRAARFGRLSVHISGLVVAVAAVAGSMVQAPPRQWLAGDSHVHSHWSPGYDNSTDPPTPVRGGDALYSTPINAQMARRYGLTWMVTTDHGGPNHSKLNASRAYAELADSRAQVPEVLQFYGLELNMPAMDHHTLIIPQNAAEWETLFEIERRFDANDAWPRDPARNTEAAALSALQHMNGLSPLPLLFANHPSRSAQGLGLYGLDEPFEFRVRNDAAPEIYRGMEGAPGHQAGTLAPDGSAKRDNDGHPAGTRGGYANPGAETRGGFDQMTAVVGGLWDALLGEGRRFWIVATSDSHANYADPSRPGSDFWPGQFHKTYVLAHLSYPDVLDGLRAGRMFVAAGDLVTELDFTAVAGNQTASTGGTLRAALADSIAVEIRFRDPNTPNGSGEDPVVQRIDLIGGEVLRPPGDRPLDRNPTTRVIARFPSNAFKKDGDRYSMTTTLPPAAHDVYLRLRGTSSHDLEPLADLRGENPWTDLWFYSNPIFVERAPQPTTGRPRS